MSVPRTTPIDRRRTPEVVDREVERAVALAFAPLHKTYFGLAVGIAAALVMAFATLASLVVDPADQLELHIFASYFYGYTVSLGGAVVGALWAGFVGYVAGWFVAFCRNLVLATWLVVIRARAQLTQTRDFLDHI